ncbi:MAG: tetratricopeptide repeat protein [Thiohalocapsa sp.]
MNPATLPHARTRSPSFAILATLGLIPLVTVLCYLPGLQGTFTFDDQFNITRNAAVQIDDLSPDGIAAAALSYGHGLFKRPLSMLTIALNHASGGLDPLPYKITNLAIHLVNGVLMFALVRLLLRTPRTGPRAGEHANRADWVALLVSAALLLHPINLTSVLYVIQRMTSLSALFCLTGMLLYTIGRLRLDRGARGGWLMMLTAAIVATPLAFASKEIGILLPGYLFLIEWLLFGFATPSRRNRWMLILLFVVIVGLPALLAAWFLLTHPHWLQGGYATRPFSMVERTLTEPRVLWLYLKLLVVPRPADLSLFHDDIPLSTGLTQPWTTLPALISLTALAIAAVLGRRRWPLAAFGILLFLCGHLLESSVIALEITHEHRNYLPGFGILLAMTTLIVGWRPNAAPRKLGVAVMVALIALYAGLTTMRANAWSHPYQLALAGVTDHPESSRWQHEMGWVLWMGRHDADVSASQAAVHADARRYFLRAAELNPYFAAGELATVLHIDSIADQPTDPRVVADLLERLPQGPVAPFTTGAFSALLECLPTQDCPRPIDEIHDLIAALAANSKLSARKRGALFASAGQFAARSQDGTQALDYLNAAIEAEPKNLQHSLNYAAVAIAAGRPDLAVEPLQKVKEQDTDNRFLETREQLESRLSKE